MDHVAILERALQTTLRHRALWVLGFLWALVGGCSGPPINFGSGSFRYELDGSEKLPAELTFGRLGTISTADINWPAVAGIILAAIAVLMLAAIVVTAIRYVLHAGIYRSLAALDRDGVEPSVRGAWRLGWNRRTWRMWLQNLVVDIPLVVLIVASLVIVAMPLLFLAASSESIKVLGVLGTVGMFFAWLLAVICIIAVVGVLKELWWRSAVVDDVDFLEAIRVGWRLARRNVGDVAIMWLLMVGATILAAVIMLLLVVVAALLAGGIAVWPAYLIWQSGRELLALAYGVPAFMVIFGVPISLAGGLYLIFNASVWSQVYEELSARSAAAAQAP